MCDFKNNIPMLDLGNERSTEKIKEIRETGHSKFYTKLNYVVGIDSPKNTCYPYCYQITLGLKFANDFEIRNKVPLTISYVKESTHLSYQGKKRIHSYEGITYLRSNEESYEMTPIVDHLDTAVICYEKMLMKTANISESEELYKKIENREITINVEELELFKQEPKIIDFFIRGQDVEQHENTFGECYNFEIFEINVKYFKHNIIEAEGSKSNLI